MNAAAAGPGSTRPNAGFMTDIGAGLREFELKSVFITGGATGIGEALVRGFAGLGAKVGFGDIQEREGEALAGSLKAEGSDCAFYPVDITSISNLHEVMDRHDGASGGLDILINNAANDTRRKIGDETPETWSKSLAVNLDAVFFGSQKAISLFGDRGGVIVNVGSINPLLGLPDMSAYVAAKSALRGLTKTMSREVGERQIRINMVSFGWVVTRKQLDLYLTPEVEAAWMEQTALKRRLEVEDAFEVVRFLASDRSRGIAGQEIVADNGRT